MNYGTVGHEWRARMLRLPPLPSLGWGVGSVLVERLQPTYLGGALPVVAVLSAYIDDSQQDGLAYGLGGYIGFPGMWEAHLKPAWNAAIKAAPHKVSEFKTSDCRQGFGEFSAKHGWTGPERTAFTRSMVDVLRDVPAAIRPIGYSAVAVFPNLPKPEWPRVEKEGFVACLLMVMRFAQSLRATSVASGEIPDSTAVQIVLDETKTLERLAGECYGAVKERVPPELSKRLRFPSFAPSDETPPIQAADLIVYEAVKEAKTRALGEARGVSKALQRLVEEGAHFAECWTWEQFSEVERRRNAGLVPLTDALRPMPLYGTGDPWRSPEQWPYCMQRG